MLIFCARERVPINVIGLQLNPENCLSQQLSSLMLKKGKKNSQTTKPKLTATLMEVLSEHSNSFELPKYFLVTYKSYLYCDVDTFCF